MTTRLFVCILIALISQGIRSYAADIYGVDPTGRCSVESEFTICDNENHKIYSDLPERKLLISFKKTNAIGSDCQINAISISKCVARRINIEDEKSFGIIIKRNTVSVDGLGVNVIPSFFECHIGEYKQKPRDAIYNKSNLKENQECRVFKTENSLAIEYYGELYETAADVGGIQSFKLIISINYGSTACYYIYNYMLADRISQDIYNGRCEIG